MSTTESFPFNIISMQPRIIFCDSNENPEYLCMVGLGNLPPATGFQNRIQCATSVIRDNYLMGIQKSKSTSSAAAC